jgi:hypothetical protein
MGDASPGLPPEHEYIGHFGGGPGGGGVAAYSPKNDVVIVTNFSDPIYPVTGLMFSCASFDIKGERCHVAS